MHRYAAAFVLCACVIAISSAEGRPRDPFSGLVASIGKAFQPMKVKRKHVAKAHPTKVSPARFKHASKPKPNHVPDAGNMVGHPDLDRYADAPLVRRGGTPNADEQPWNKGSGNAVLPDMQALRDIVVIYAERHGIEPSLALALVQVESRFDPWATGSAGEIGLGQIRCATAKEEGYAGSCRNLYGVGVNLLYSMKYLAHAKRRGDGSQCGTLSKYNAGLYSNERRSDYCRRIIAAMN